MAWLQKKPQVEEIQAEKETLKQDISKLKKQVEELEEPEKPKKVYKDEEVRIQIVKELPIQQLRQVKGEDGIVTKFYTVEEYLTMMANEKD